MHRFFIVGLGGALGAVARYSIGLFPVRSSFPVLTLLINLLGSLVIGFIAGVSAQNNISKEWELFWKTGICGGFTTFSTFSLEAWKLLESGKFLYGVIYILLSVSLSIAGVIIGQYFGSRLVRA